jgi:hypothetical protein
MFDEGLVLSSHLFKSSLAPTAKEWNKESVLEAVLSCRSE